MRIEREKDSKKKKEELCVRILSKCQHSILVLSYITNKGYEHHPNGCVCV